jgi:hypothetical protein
MTDRTIENDLTPTSNAQRNRRMKARLVEAHDRIPDRVDVLLGQAHSTGVCLAVTLRGHLLRIKDADGHWKQISKARPLHHASRW